MTLNGIITRASKGAALAWAEVDANFTKIKNAINTLFALFGATFNADGTLKDGAISSSDMLSDAVKAELVDLSHPLGSILPVAGPDDEPPSAKWVLCDGQAINRTTYAAYYALVGTAFGTGDGSTTFNVPDIRGRALIGAGEGTSLTARTLGEKVGAETHQLTTAEIPAHKHDLERDINEVPNDNSGGAHCATMDLAGGTTGLDPMTETEETGGGGAHNNMQPSLAVNFYVKIAA